MPDPVEPRDRLGRTFSDYVADQVMAAAIDSGMSIRALARASGLERTGLQDRLNGVRSFNLDHLARIAAVLELNPCVFTAGFEPV